MEAIYDDKFCADILALSEEKPLLKKLLIPFGKDIPAFMKSLPRCPIKKEIFETCGRIYPVEW